MAQKIWEAIKEANVVYERGLNMDHLNGNMQHVANSWIVQSDVGCFLMVPLRLNVT